MNATATSTAAVHPADQATAQPVSSVAVRDTTRRLPLLRAGLGAGAVAALANTLVVLAARAADIPVSVGGESIPLLGFAQLTLIGALLGVALARAVTRTRQPQRVFTVTTVVLTALSLVPDATADATTATRLVLALTHLVAAAIIVPALASRIRP